MPIPRELGRALEWSIQPCLINAHPPLIGKSQQSSIWFTSTSCPSRLKCRAWRMATFGLPTASRQTGFETAFPGRCWGSQSRAQSKKPRVVRGLRLPQGLLNRVEVFVLAETERFELSMRLNTPYSLSRGAPSATRSRFLSPVLCLILVQIKRLVQRSDGQLHIFFVNHH